MPILTRSLLVLVLAGAAAQPASAQNVRLADQDPVVRRALAALQRDQAWTLAQQIAICEIPAPPFKEAARADDFKRRLIALGYLDTRIDAVGNVITQVGGGSGPTVMVAAHLDTVFPEGTDVKTTRTGDRIAGPGIGDDCRGLAALLTLAKAFKETGLTPNGRVYRWATSAKRAPATCAECGTCSMRS